MISAGVRSDPRALLGTLPGAPTTDSSRVTRNKWLAEVFTTPATDLSSTVATTEVGGHRTDGDGLYLQRVRGGQVGTLF